MSQRLSEFESLLRGDGALDTGSAGASPPRARELLLMILAGGALYGACMALFGMLHDNGYGLPHLLSVMIKVPALFLLTLVVTGPSLYVFAALTRSSLRLGSTLYLLLSSTAVAVIVLASFGPVTAFFVFSTRSYPFVQLQNVAIFSVAGVVGLRHMRGQMAAAFDGEGGSTAELRKKTLRLLSIWFAIYALVGAQMGWLLRPFIGSPGLEPELFRGTESNIFECLIEALEWL